jgi:Flp pilus assembly pilin Flp
LNLYLTPLLCDYRSMFLSKSNYKAVVGRPKLRLGRLAREQAGQTTVEYMLVVVLLVVGMAAALQALFPAMQVLFNRLAGLIALPYP